MGETYHYRCSKCGLYAEVSGGVDGGFIAQVQTVYCRPCDALTDVATQLFEEEYDKSALNKCPRCQGNDFTPWNEGEPCPRCGSQIENEGLASDWD